MKRLLKLLFFLVLVTIVMSCGEKPEDQKTVANLQQKIEQLTKKISELEKENASLMGKIKELTQEVSEKEVYKFGLLLVGPYNDHGWSQAHFDGGKGIMWKR